MLQLRIQFRLYLLQFFLFFLDKGSLFYFYALSLKFFFDQ